MFGLIGIAINAVLVLMMFGLYSKIDRLTQAMNDLADRGGGAAPASESTPVDLIPPDAPA